MQLPYDRTEETRVYRFFLWSVLLKGAISVAEIAAGTLFLFIEPRAIVEIASRLSSDLLPSFADHYAQLFLSAALKEFLVAGALFVALYLIARGAVKFVLIAGMLKNILWTYPASMGVIGIFILYQLYQIATTHSALIVALTVFDLAVLYFINLEYKILKQKPRGT